MITSQHHGHMRRIPRIIMQTGKTDDMKSNLSRSWTLTNPGFKYHFLNDSAAVRFLGENFDSNYVKAFNNLKPGAVKADFLRLAWLYKKGGFFIDLDREPVQLERYISAAGLVLTRSTPGNNADAFCQGHVYNGFMAVRRKSKYIASALRLALHRSLTSWVLPADPDFEELSPPHSLGLLKLCYSIAGPTLLGAQLCAGLSSAEVCTYSGGGVRGKGCRLPPNTKTTLVSNESVLIVEEAQVFPVRAQLLRLETASKATFSTSEKHYVDECGHGHIYVNRDLESDLDDSPTTPAADSADGLIANSAVHPATNSDEMPAAESTPTVNSEKVPAATEGANSAEDLAANSSTIAVADSADGPTADAAVHPATNSDKFPEDTA